MQGESMISRRGFNVLAAAGLMGLPLARSTQADPPGKPGWIDAHVHVWTPDLQAYPLDPHFQREDMQPPSFTPEELFAHARPAGVSRIVLIQMSFYRFDNRYMLDMIARYPGVSSGVGIVDQQFHLPAR